MPVGLESDIQGGVQKILKKLAEVVKDSEGIDLSPLKQAAGIV